MAEAKQIKLLTEALQRKSDSLTNAHSALQEHAALLVNIYDKIEILHGVINSAMKTMSTKAQGKHIKQVYKILEDVLKDNEVSKKITTSRASMVAEKGDGDDGSGQREREVKTLQGAVGRQTKMISTLLEQDVGQRVEIESLLREIRTLKEKVCEVQSRHLSKVEEYEGMRSAMERKIQHLEIRNESLSKANEDLQKKITKLSGEGTTAFI